MRSIVAALCFLISSGATASAGDKAWYGFHIKAQTSGFVLNPVVQSVLVDMIAPNSPATAQDIHVGDEIIEADGQPVPGTRALQLLSILNKRAGQTLRLNLRRPGGQTYRVMIVGIRKPGT